MSERHAKTKESDSPGERQAAFDRAGVALVAEALGVDAERLPFSIPGREVYQLILADRRGRAQTLLTLWPWIGRVDVVAGAATMIVSGVALIRVAASGDVTFCRRGGETVVVGRDGRVVVRM